jgi:hypothetical protein
LESIHAATKHFDSRPTSLGRLRIEMFDSDELVWRNTATPRSTRLNAIINVLKLCLPSFL